MFLGTIYFDVGLKHPKIILANYSYNFHTRMGNRTLWMCPSYYKTKCKCKVITTGRVVQIHHEHNHAPNYDPSKYQNMSSKKVTIVKNC